MDIKKLITAALTGVLLLAGLVGIGTAAVLEINIYGSSAQYSYWNAEAWGIFNSMNCTDIRQATFDFNNAVTVATCSYPWFPFYPGSGPVVLRVSRKSDGMDGYDAIEALLGNDSYTIAGPTAERCSPGDPGDPGAGQAVYYRKMVDESSCTSWEYPSGPTCTSLKCVRVTLAASDVEAHSYTQSSHGNLWGLLEVSGRIAFFPQFPFR